MNKSIPFQEFKMDRVERLRDACAAVGRSFYSSAEKRTDRQYAHYENAVAATYFRRAAAHSVLLDDFQTACKYFGKASRCYGLAEMPYGILMEVLCGAHTDDSSWGKVTESPQEVYKLIADLGMKKGTLDEVRKSRHKLDDFRGKNLGVLAIPFDQYLDLFDALYLATENPKSGLRRVRQAVLPFVQTYSSALQRAKRDTFHWERLAMVFHPVEPDIVGLLSMTISALGKSRVSHSDLLKGLLVNQEAVNILMYCLDHLTIRPDNYTEHNRE